MTNESVCITSQYLTSPLFIVQACGLGLVNAIIILGNILVVLAACTSAKLQTALTSTFVVSLATSDLLLGLLVLPFSIAYQLLLKHWIFSRWWCQIWLAVDVWTCTASILNLVVISLDRYLSLRHPLKYPKLMNRRRARVLVACVWILAFAISLPTLFKLFLQNSDQDTSTAELMISERTFNSSSSLLANETSPCLDFGQQCTIAHSTQLYIVYSALGSFFLPLSVMIYFYLHIFASVHRTLKAGRRGVLASRESAAQHGELRIHRGGGGGATTSGGAGNFGGGGVSIVSRRVRLVKNSQQGQQQNQLVPPGANTSRKPSWNTLINVATKYAPFSGRYGRELKAARMLAIICVTFIGCWAPFFSVYLFGAFCQDCVAPLTFDICFWLGYVNSALNPFIYALFSADYRRAFKTLVLRRQRRAYQTIRQLARGGLHGMEVVTAAQATATASFSLGNPAGKC